MQLMPASWPAEDSRAPLPWPRCCSWSVSIRLGHAHGKACVMPLVRKQVLQGVCDTLLAPDDADFHKLLDILRGSLRLLRLRRSVGCQRGGPGGRMLRESEIRGRCLRTISMTLCTSRCFSGAAQHGSGSFPAHRALVERECSVLCLSFVGTTTSADATAEEPGCRGRFGHLDDGPCRRAAERGVVHF